MRYMNTTALHTQHTRLRVRGTPAPPSTTRAAIADQTQRMEMFANSWRTPEPNRWNHIPSLCGADRGRGEQQLFNLLVIKRSVLVFLVHWVQWQILFFTH